MTHLVYVTDYNHGTVVVIDGTTDTVTATIPLADPVLDPKPRPFGVAVDTATDTIYVADYSGNQVEVIDGATNAVTARIALPARSDPSGIAFDPAAGLVYVADTLTGAISVISTATDSLSTLTSGMTEQTEPTGLALDSGTGSLYVTSQAGSNNVGTTYVVDAASGAITAQIPRGGGLSVAISSAGGSAVAVGSGPLADEVTVIAPSTVNTMSPVIVGNTSFTSTVGQAGQAQLTASAIPGATFSATGPAAGASQTDLAGAGLNHQAAAAHPRRLR